MRNQNFDLNTILAIDAAPASMIDDATSIKAKARLEQIFELPATPEAAPNRQRRLALNPRLTLRWATIPVVAAGALALSIILPNGQALLPAQASFASWTAVPTSFSVTEFGDEIALADAACRAVLVEMLEPRRFPDFVTDAIPGSVIPGNEVNVLAELPDTSAGPVMQEIRGDWATLLYRGTDGVISNCLLDIRDGQHPIVASMQVLPPMQNASWNWMPAQWVNFEMFGIFGGGGTSQFGPNVDVANIEPDEAVNSVTMTTHLPDGTGFTYVVGRVGENVASLALQTYDAGEVAASIDDGIFFAWWPGYEGAGEACSWSTSADGSVSNQVGCDLVSTMTLTYRDGTIARMPFDSPYNVTD